MLRHGRSVARRSDAVGADAVIGIVIPAHNEAALLAGCLQAALCAAAHPGLAGERVEILVVLDSCTDGTAAIANACGVATIALDARNVGAARAAGAHRLLEQGARWLAFTDADSRVSAQWLVDQLAQHADAVCGTVQVDDWSDHGELASALHAHFLQTYFDQEGHSHIHGANLGVSAEAYRRAGGFPPLACSEDVALVAALRSSGARIAWSCAPRVTTSARRHARALGGFADALLAVVHIARPTAAS